MKVHGSLRPGQRTPIDPAWHDTPPEDARPVARVERYQTAIGIDLSYSGRGDSAAVCVVSRECADTFRDRYYVRDLWSGARELRSLRSTLAGYQARYPDAVLCSYVSGTEKGVLGLLAEESRDPATGDRVPAISVVPMLATESKVARAASTIELWNLGRIVLPRRDWAESLARRVAGFDGSAGGSDDEVDALVSAVAFLRMAGGAVDTSRMSARRTSV